LAGVTAAQVSEFGFILIFTGSSMGHIDESILPIFTFVALLTIFVSSYLITYNDKIFLFIKPFFDLFGKDKRIQSPQKSASFDTWIFGYHRTGWKIGEFFKKRKVKYAVVDFNRETVELLGKKGVPAFFGDVSDIEFLEMLPLKKARLIISTFPDPADQSTFVSYVRSINRKALIITTLNQNMHLEEMYRLGADYVLMSHLIAGQWLSHFLGKGRWTKKRFENLKSRQFLEIKKRRKSLLLMKETPS
jgi:Trk K+ transport system NAD-binding subunit